MSLGLPFLSRRRDEVIEGILVRGSGDFVGRTRQALDALERAGYLGSVARHIAVIRQGRRSGMKAWLPEPTFVVGKRTWTSSVIWYAGTLAHDAHHSKLYQEARKRVQGKEPPSATWTGIEAERQCLAFQREVLRGLNAHPGVIEYVEDWERDPSYAGSTRGWRSYWEYLRRWW